MKNRNSFLTISLALCMMFLVLMTTNQVIAGDDNKSPLRSITDYSLVAQFEIFDDDGRFLVWKSTLKGDIEGFMLWWFDQPDPPVLVHEDFVVKFYTGRWEIFDTDPLPPDGSGGLGSNPDARLLLAGRSGGQSLIPLDPPGQDAIWDGYGIVTETSKEYRHLKRGIIYEGGPVVLTSFPYYGTGKIRIHPHGFRIRDFFSKPASEAPEERVVPEEFGFLHNYPNPFNPSTTIEFDLPEATEVRIDIYNNAGQKVRTLLNREMQAGNHKVKWNASEMASGIYYYKIQASGFQDVKRMVLIK